MVAARQEGENGHLPLPKDGGNKDHKVSPVEAWKNAIPQYIQYPEGNYDLNGLSYFYEEGVRLEIGGNQVMDTAERPWANATVDAAFDALKASRRDEDKNNPVRVLERGFGLGITADRVINHLRISGGSYEVIELNDGVVERATSWKRHKEAQPKKLPEFKGSANVSVNVWPGDAIRATEKRAELIGKGVENTVDIIISDTFPLDPKDEGINDLKDIEVLKRCLAPNGVFTFFAYYPGFPGRLSAKQLSYLLPHFENSRTFHIPVFPPPDYKYLHENGVPVRTLPVVIFKNPIFS